MDDLAGRKELIKFSRLKSGYVLDIGMGDCGCMSFFLASRGFDVVGIDYSPYAIHESRKDAVRKKIKGSFKAKLANAENLPFESNEFDAIFSYHSMHCMDNVKKVIKEMFRVCKPDGLVLISDLNDRGRKAYKHSPDDGKSLKKINVLLSKYAKSIRKTETKYNTILICKKQ